MDVDLQMAYDGISNVIDVCSLNEPGDRFDVRTLLGEGTYGEVHVQFVGAESCYLRVG
jgi:hypothetical protein